MRERLSFAGIWLARPKIPDGPKHDFLPRKKTNGHEQPRSVPSGSTKSRIGSRHALIVYVQGFDMIIYPSALKNVLPPLVLQRSTGLDEIVLQTDCSGLLALFALEISLVPFCSFFKLPHVPFGLWVTLDTILWHIHGFSTDV